MATVRTTTVTQSANEVLGTKEKVLYYLIIETLKGKLVINVGEKTHKEVKELTKDELEIMENENKLEDARNRTLAQDAANKNGGKK